MAEIAAVEDYASTANRPRPTVTAKPFRTVTTCAGGKEMTLNYPRWEQFFRHNTRESAKPADLTAQPPRRTDRLCRNRP